MSEQQSTQRAGLLPRVSIRLFVPAKGVRPTKASAVVLPTFNVVRGKRIFRYIYSINGTPS